MIRLFKKFADKINSKRTKPFDFISMVLREASKYNKILEVGCNLRPINKKSNSYTLHGIDPDKSIEMNDAYILFDDFHITGIENYDCNIKYDLIIMDMVFEHLEDNRVTIKKLNKLLGSNGEIMIHAPSSLHPFALLNRLFPHDFKIKLLKTLRPWSEVGTTTGWRSYYDKCNIFQLKKIAKIEGLVVKKSFINYNASDYFAFFPPLFLMIVLFEEVCSLFNLKIFCGSFVAILERKDDNNG